jgi:transcriptional regulator with XRE-family HTH domain
MLIKQARLRAHLSQRDLAGRLGITASAVAQWELGQSRPGTGRLAALAEVLGVSMDSLLGRSVQSLPAVAPDSHGNDLRLLDEVRRLGVDLRQVLAEARQRRWLEENREALADANDFLERYGLWSDGRRLF